MATYKEFYEVTVYRGEKCAETTICAIQDGCKLKKINRKVY